MRKSDEDTTYLDSEICSRACRTNFQQQAFLMIGVMALLPKTKQELPSVLSSFAFAIWQTGTSLEILTNHEVPSVRDCYILGRAMFETILNACYVCAKGESLAEQAIRHAQQKKYRSFDRKVSVNDTVLSLKRAPEVDLDKFPDLKAAVEEFTTRSGRERTEWTNDSLVKRIEAVDKKYDGKASKLLTIGMLQIYRDASEMVHGTLYSVLDYMGRLDGRPSDEKGKRNLKQRDIPRINLLLIILSLCINQLIRILGQEFSLDDIVADSNKSDEKMMAASKEFGDTSAPSSEG